MIYILKDVCVINEYQSGAWASKIYFGGWLRGIDEYLLGGGRIYQLSCSHQMKEEDYGGYRFWLSAKLRILSATMAYDESIDTGSVPVAVSQEIV